MRTRLAASALQALQRTRSSAVAEVARSGSFALFRADADAALSRPELQFAAAQQGRSLFTSVPTSFEAAPVEGDAAGVLKQIDAVVSNENATAKEIADAAVSLAYLQAKDARRVWGKTFEAAVAAKDSFDAASLSAFLWAATTAGVSHFQTVFELSGAVASNLKSFTPTQLSVAVEALGKAHVKDSELFGKIADVVTADMAKYKPAELSRVLYGFAAACQNDGKLVKAIASSLAGKASELGSREAVQAVYSLAKLRRADKASLDALIKAAAAKVGSAESGVDAAALAWSLGYLGITDAAASKAAAAALKSSAASLAPAHAIDAAWGLAVSGSADPATMTALFDSIAAAVDKAPDSFDVYQLGALYNAAMLAPGAKLPAKVMSYAEKMYALGGEAIKLKRSSAVKAFRADLAEAAARAAGARYRPEITAAVAGFAKTEGGVSVDIAMDLDGTKLAIEAVCPNQLSSSGAPLGPAIARAKLLEAKGYKVVSVPITAWQGLSGDKDKAAYLLKAAKAAAPGAATKLSALEQKLGQPFDPYAE